MRFEGSRRILVLFIGIGLLVGSASLTAQESADEPKADGAAPKVGAKSKIRSRTKSRRPSSRKDLSKTAPKNDDEMDGVKKPAEDNDAAIKFSRDIAPILVGNCISCHNPKDKARRKDFDLTTFAGLMKGGADGPAITPGKPDETLLLLRVKGEETPKMPPGQNNLGPEAIAKIEEWVKAGAILDGGIDPMALLEKVAPTPEMLRRQSLAKMSPEELDAAAKAVALDRWKKATTKTTPEMTSDKHFVVFGNIPENRTKALLKVLEGEYTTIGRLLGPLADKTPLTSPEKISVYVFNDSNLYVEFVRSFENRELESGAETHANFAIDNPYIAVVDPLQGGEEALAKPAKKSSRSKRAAAEEAAGGPDRSLAGLVSESLGVGVISSAGKPPKWLSLGLGAFLASRVEARSPYYRELRSEAYTAFEQGSSKVREAVGGEGDNQRIRAVGFSLVEWLATAQQARLPLFVREMVEGGEKFDDAAQGIFSTPPDQFLNYWGNFVATRYGRRR
jgi:hypothetical protein